MDSSTVAVVLALTLVFTGGMFALIAKQIQGRSGMATFALGLALFGLVYAVPKQVDEQAPLVLGVLIDSMAVAAVLLLWRGLQRFMHQSELSWERIGIALAVFVGVSAAARLAFGAPARPAVLVLTLMLLFGALALITLRDAHRDNPALRTPLLLLSAVLGVLSLLSLVQGVHGLVRGAAATSDAGTWIYDAILMLCALLLGPTLLWLHSTQLARQLVELSTRDPLTKLLNEQGFEDMLQRHFARRQHEPVALMHVDVDEFNRINKLHGEAAGDDVLRMLAVVLENTLRADDIVARVGGDEFVVACVNSEIDNAATLAKRLLAAASAMQTGLVELGAPLRCTLSIGLSHPFNRIEHWHQAWREAELSLDAAKNAFGNCVVHPKPAAAEATVPAGL